MKLLGIDSSSLAASCALNDGGALLGEYFIHNKMTHSQTLMPMVRELLLRTDTSLSGLDALAVTVGPGSFTGLRIGIASAKGLAMGADKPCVALSTLESLAFNLGGFEGVICPAMDARRQQVYTALFKVQAGRPARLTGDMALPLAQLAKLLEERREPVIFVGDGAALCYNEFGRAAGYLLAPEALRHQRASSVCAAALAALEENPQRLICADALEPAYLRLPQAERELLEKQREAEKL